MSLVDGITEVKGVAGQGQEVRTSVGSPATGKAMEVKAHSQTRGSPRYGPCFSVPKQRSLDVWSPNSDSCSISEEGLP